jgi:undecaprenyl diphosphate synthase
MTDPLLQYHLQSESLPQHLGIIMDGNGRWAKQRLLPRVAGHKKGVERVKEITEFCGNCGIQALTIYAFSDENWRRPEEEVSGLMSLLRWYLRAERKTLLANGVRFRVIGDRLKLSSDILAMIKDLEEETAQNQGLKLQVALSYGGRGEILRALRKYVLSLNESGKFPQDVDEATFESFLDTAGLPEVDLLIRTSGEQRLSNFLLWQCAYAEFYFEPAFWPDFSKETLAQILRCFAKRERRFGRTSDQVRQLSLVQGRMD